MSVMIEMLKSTIMEKLLTSMLILVKELSEKEKILITLMMFSELKLEPKNLMKIKKKNKIFMMKKLKKSIQMTKKLMMMTLLFPLNLIKRTLSMTKKILVMM